MDVVEKPEENRFELSLDGGTALVAYQRDGNRLVLLHTEVPSEFSGQGIGSRLAKGVLDQIRASGRKAVIRCPFLKEWIARHPEYDDIVDG
ncbi:GNAT family N-acetyltransferase [Bosea sp. BH3]|uniref:GNAT family N-acetyltransferase n=1 Tax=Bosea sp. BH3 TaxID=2871701 RepID=UPI0021CB1D6F|nr:GNAT family N-acetyltransferase [Bosea sp. BH3]MCU4178757.1 N-acetyltransferase [Bosea sp. BH3]